MKSIALLMLAAFLVLPGCDEDDPVKPEPFAVTVRVRDADGSPVAGLVLGMLNVTDYIQDRATRKAMTSIRFDMPQAARVAISAEDIEGNVVAVLGDEWHSTGAHVWAWIPYDEEDRYLPSGRYTIRMRAWDQEENELFEDSRDVLLAAMYVAVDTTDADGEIELTDLRHFPHLYGRPPMEAVSEDGIVLGTFTETSAMRFYLTDQIGLMGMRFDVEVTAEGGVMDLVWNPSVPAAVRFAPTPPQRGAGPPEVPGEFVMHPPYPNPFN